MILFLDTSALVKLYVAEAGSAALRHRIRRASALAASVLAYPEARATFARLRRSGLTTDRQHERRLLRFERDWESFMRVDCALEVARLAGNLAEVYALRGFDAVHLASATWLKDRAAEPVSFGVYDVRLHTAAAVIGFTVYPKRLPRPARLWAAEEGLAYQRRVRSERRRRR